MLALDPNETVEIVLAIDAEKPADQQPKFIVRFLTCRQTLQYKKLFGEAFALPADQPEKENELLNQALAIALVGWKNVRDRASGQEIAFSLDALDDGPTPREKWRLVHQVLDAVFLAEKEKKAYASSPPGGGGASASTAEPANA